MISILFICHGNICRSPMAEFILKDMVKKRGLDSDFRIASAATSREEIGNPVYPPARRKLAENGITCSGHHARRMTRDDYDEYDLIICMDHANVRNARIIAGGDPDNKIVLILDYTKRKGQEVADPWYTGDFDATWDDLIEGCEALLNKLGTELNPLIDRSEALKEAYSLVKHDEGGYFAEVYTSGSSMDGRAFAGSIFYLLGAGESSRYHQIDCDEIWFYHEGCGMRITVLLPTGEREEHLIGRNFDKGERAMAVIPKGSVFAAENLEADGFTFVSCLTVPKFSLDGYRILSDDEIG